MRWLYQKAIPMIAVVLMCMMFCNCSKQEQEPCIIYGTVFFWNGKPVSGAKIKVTDGSVLYSNSFSGSDGYYEISFTPEQEGYIQVEVDVNGYYSDIEKFEIKYGQRVQCDFVLDP